MDLNIDENDEQMQAMMRQLLDGFLGSLDEKVSQEDIAALRLELEAVVLPLEKEPPLTETQQLDQNFDKILHGISTFFPDGLPEGVLNTKSENSIQEELEKLDDQTLKLFDKDLKFAEGLRNHKLAGFINSLASDDRNHMPEICIPPANMEEQKPPEYSYKPLDLSSDASRLVVLHPGDRNQPVKCSLIPLPLSVFESPDDKSTYTSRYEALSYVWGSPVDPIIIMIDEQTFKVGQNLFSALVNLRLGDKDRLLWIDAICIDQSNIEERNWQVSRMGLIYRSALQTQAYLGPATWGSDMICTAILAHQTVLEDGGDTLPHELEIIDAALFGTENEDLKSSNVDHSFIEILWDQFDQLFERALFSRSWIVQEIALARHVSIQCGSISFPYEILEIAMAEAGMRRSSMGIKVYTPLKTGLTKFTSFSILRSQLRKTDRELPLFFYAARFGRLLATDQRDRIYAFLSLSPSLVQKGVLLDHGFSPDYSKSTLDVYRDFALFCIQKYNNLNLLSRPFRNNREHPLEYENWVGDWPSWVPDWERRGIKEQDFAGLDANDSNEFRDYNAAGYWEDVELAQVDERTIALFGVVFDEVAAVVEGDIFSDPREVSGDREEWDEWEAFAMQVGGLYGETILEKQEAFWRTLLADSDGGGSFAPDEFGTMFQCWRSGTQSHDTELFTKFINQMFNTVRGRMLFITKRGYLGLGSWQTEVGDSICVLKGGKMPVLGRESGATMEQVIAVRDEEHVDIREIPVYRLMGSGGTYIHGIMDGEAVGIVEEEELKVEPIFFC